MKTNAPWSDSLRKPLLIAHLGGTIAGTKMPEDVREDWTSAAEAGDAYNVLSAGDLVFLTHEISRMQVQYAGREDAVLFLNALATFTTVLDREVDA